MYGGNTQVKDFHGVIWKTLFSRKSIPFCTSWLKEASQRSRRASFRHRVLLLAGCAAGGTFDLFPSVFCGNRFLCGEDVKGAKPHFWLSDKKPEPKTLPCSPSVPTSLPFTLTCPGPHFQLESIYDAHQGFLTGFYPVKMLNGHDILYAMIDRIGDSGIFFIYIMTMPQTERENWGSHIQVKVFLIYPVC